MNHNLKMNLTPDDGEEADLQRWIDELLRSIDAAELEAAPAAVAMAASSSKSLGRRRLAIRRSFVGVVTAAAMVAAAVMWSGSPLPRGMLSSEGSKSAQVVRAPGSPATVDNPSPSLSLQGRGIEVATFESGGDAIAVPMASEDPQVSIVKVYPTTTTERRWRRETTLYANLSGQDGG